ncbi:MAG: hypothetical protein VZQ83_02440 [Eubacterium sp.]|nr:hypothetical protein [Eubacterium sp.]
MRFKRNPVTIAYSAVFILLMLIGVFYIVSMSYDSFDVSGLGVIYAVLMGIGVVLIFIASYFLHEKRALKGIQAEKAPLIIIEGLLVVAAVVFGFYYNMKADVENGIWIGVYLAVIYGICRILGGRICGVIGLGISLALTCFAFDTGWAVLAKSELIDVLCILVPFFTFLIVFKYLIPQFGKESFIVVCSLIVQSAIFGAAIALNPLAAVLCLGCVLALLFANLRTVDTVVTKGPLMAVILLVLSAGCAFGVSILLDKDFFSLFSIKLDADFQAASSGGSVIKYSLDKFHDLLGDVLYHVFDYGIFSTVILLFAAVAGFFAIRRKLSEIGPLILTMIVALFGYVMVGRTGSHGFYLTYMIGIFAAYGMYNALLPEFLYFDKDEDNYDFDEAPSSAIPAANHTEVKEKVADENRESSSSDSSDVSEAAQTVNSSREAGNAGSPGQVTSTASEDAHFQEWHVSAEYVREDELRKERQEERERSYRVAKEQAEAKAAGKSEEDIAAIAIAAEDEVKASAPGRVVFTGDESGPSHDTVLDSVQQSAAAGQDDLVLDFSDVVQENTDGVASTPVSTPPASIQSGIDYGPDMSQIPTKSLSDEEEAQELRSNYKSDTDTIVLSGYQNEKKMHGAADLLNAINEAQIPTVEIPDVPSVTPTVSEPASVPASEDGTDLSFFDSTDANEAADADMKLAEVAANFTVEESANTIQPGEDEQLDNLLDRLDMSDSIKRMSASAREDMADVIEQADDQTEDEVVLVNEDYNFGSEDGEYGEVPTVSDLEDRWRAEQAMQQVPEEEVPDVVSAEETDDAQGITFADTMTEVPAAEPVPVVPPTPEPSPIDDVTSGFDFTGGFDVASEPAAETPLDEMAETPLAEMPVDTRPMDEIGSSVPDSMDDMISAELSEEPTDNMLMMDTSEEDADDMISMDMTEDSADDMVSSFRPDTPEDEMDFMDMPTEPAAEPAEAFTPVESVAEPAEAFTPVEPVAESTEFVSFRDMATQGSGTTPEEIAPAAEPEVKITPFEPERIEAPKYTAEPEFQPTEVRPEPEFQSTEVRPEPEMRIQSEPEFQPAPEPVPAPAPEPVINNTEQSPVYSFTSKDVNIDIREDEGQLGIPKPGQEPMSHYVDRYAAAVSRSGKPLAAELDDYEKKIKDRPIHTEEVVNHSGNGSRSYHKIILK